MFFKKRKIGHEDILSLILVITLGAILLVIINLCIVGML